MSNRDPHEIIIRPHITEKSVAMSYGDSRIHDESQLVRKYTFLVAEHANKIEIKGAFEAIYNAGRKQTEALEVTAVNTVKLPGKLKRRGMRRSGLTSVRRKAIITLAKGQILEDYGV